MRVWKLKMTKKFQRYLNDLEEKGSQGNIQMILHKFYLLFLRSILLNITTEQKNQSEFGKLML